MKLIENPLFDSKSRLPAQLNRIVRSFRFGSTVSNDMQAQEEIIVSLQIGLDHRYVMLRNVSLEGHQVPVPLVLVGPPGVHVMYASGTPGVFRAKGDTWEKMDDNRKRFQPALPNIIARASIMARTVEEYLTSRDHQVDVEPVLVFSDPGTHVEMIRPAMRIVLADALGRFAASLAQGRTTLDQEDIEAVVNLLTEAQAETDTEAAPSKRDAFDFVEEESPRRQILPGLAQSNFNQRFMSTLGKFPFTNRQWLLLGVMVFVNIIVLIAVIVVILIYS